MSEFDSLSVIVVAYNAATRLPATLRALARLEMPHGMQLQFIFVDNRSTDDSSGVVVREWQACGGLQRFGPWTMLREETPGSAFARRTGMAHAAGDLVLLVDDDNSLHPQYVARGVDLFRAHPRLGACAGVGIVSSTVPIPDWFSQAESLYVCGERGLGECTILPTAGLIVRREVLGELQSVGFRPVLDGRVGADTMCGEDSEFTAVISLLGWRLWKDRDMRFEHCLEPRRLTDAYCMQLAEGIGRSNVFVAEYMRWVARQTGRRVFKLAVPWVVTLSLQRILYSVQLLLTRGDAFAARQRRATLAGLRDGAAMGLRIERFRKLRGELRQLCERVQRYRMRSEETAGSPQIRDCDSTGVRSIMIPPVQSE